MRARRGEGFVDTLLVLSVVLVAVIVAAYVWMPDFQRGVHTLIREGSARLLGLS